MTDWPNIFNGENSKTSAALKNIWDDIDVEYRREFNLPVIANEEILSIDIEESRTENFSQRMYSDAADCLGKISTAVQVFSVESEIFLVQSGTQHSVFLQMLTIFSAGQTQEKIGVIRFV